MERTCEYPTLEEEDQFIKKQLRKNLYNKNTPRAYCNFVECGLPHRCQQLEDKFTDYSSTSSSSSSSSSDSEEEFTTPINKTFKTNKYHRQSMEQFPEGALRNKWFTMVELEGLRPEEVTAEINVKCRILLLKLKLHQQEQTHHSRQEMETTPYFGDKLVRVLPLPSNIVLEKLRVQVVLRANCLLVKAPFFTSRYGEHATLQQQERFLPAWIPVRVIVKNTVTMETLRAAQRYQPLKMKDFPNKWISYERFKRYWKQQRNTFNTFTSGNHFNPLEETSTFYQPEFFSRKWNKQMSHSTPVLPMTEVIFDEVINKPVMLLKVNVIGFRTEEVRVRVDEAQRVLIVEAVKKNVEHLELQDVEQHLVTKYLRREFFLPRFLDVEHIDFRVLKTGILIVKVPIVKKQQQQVHNMKNINCFNCRIPECVCEEFKKEAQLTNEDWEKPLRA